MNRHLNRQQKKHAPPKLARWLLRQIIKREYRYSALGDFEEMFGSVANQSGLFKAQLWFWAQVIKSIPSFIGDLFYWSAVMFKNYLKIAIRNFLKQKTFSFINMAGLGIGMACCILLLLFIQDELSFDKFHKNADHIYRVVKETVYEERVDHFAHTPAPMALALMNDFPEVVNAVRFAHRQRELISYENKQFWEDHFILADPGIFEVFTFPLIKGDPKTALRDLYSIVITEDMAKKYFEDDDPVGKRLRIGGYRTNEYKVTGVLKNIPNNSQLQFDFLASFAHQKSNVSWGASNYTTYIMLHQDYPFQELEKKLPDFIGKYQGEEAKANIKLHLQPLTQIHLHSNLRGDLPTNRNISHIYIFSGIAFLILMIACINYINLTTARFSCREKEVGMRKVVGAQRTHLMMQFMAESILFSFIALLLALLLADLFLPTFNALAGKELQLNLENNYSLHAGLLGITLLVGIFAGSYPAFVISSFRPLRILKARFGEQHYSRRSIPRRILVVLQFAVSIIFITCTAIVVKQLSYIETKNLGYDKEHIVAVPIYYSEILNKYESYKNEILQNTNILGASAAAYLPSQRGYNQTTWWEGLPEDDSSNMMRWIPVDGDFISTLGIELVAGRNFSLRQGGAADAEDEYILNESAVKYLGWQNPIGKRFKIIKKGTVVGIVRDFHFRSLHHEIEPMALHNFRKIYQYLLVKIQPNDVPKTLAFLQQKWEIFVPGRPFDYFFLDDDFDRICKSETRMSKIFGHIATIAIFIACLGLFGLAAFAAERRTKEIGIRKVLGASVANIISLLSSEFMAVVAISNLIAWPVSWFAMHRWLQDFAYRIDISWWLFAFAGGLALTIALLTVSFQVARAALANPVEALRYE